MHQRWSRAPKVRGSGLKKIRGQGLGPTLRGQPLLIGKGVQVLKIQHFAKLLVII